MRGGADVVNVKLTQAVGEEVRGEALGSVAHGRVVVSVSAEHQHRAARYDCGVQVSEEATVSQDCPTQHRLIYQTRFTQGYMYFFFSFQNY